MSEAQGEDVLLLQELQGSHLLRLRNDVRIGNERRNSAQRARVRQAIERGREGRGAAQIPADPAEREEEAPHEDVRGIAHSDRRPAPPKGAEEHRARKVQHLRTVLIEADDRENRKASV